MGPFRIEPAGPAAAYKTFQISAPLATHWVDATCEEVACERWLNGWQTVVDESTQLGQRQAYYIRHDKSRSHAEARRKEGTTVFSFGPGQRCFGGGHKKPLGRPDGSW